MQTTKAAFGWVGGKSKLAKDIIALMPKHDKYVEVFGGALSVFYQKSPSKCEILNDINGELINLHRIIKTRPQSLNIELNNMLRSREIFYLIKDKKLKPRNNIQRAALYFYLISLSFGSKGNNFVMAKNRNPKNIYRDFAVQSRKLKRAIIENMSYERLIKEYDSKDTLFYLDPPYVGTESYYKTPKDFNIADHKNLSYILSNINAKFILSYNDCDLVRELYSDFIIKELNIRYTLNAKTNKINKELLIMIF
ncbi:adenine-specific DNA methyltransferase [Campylobacter pinnipediorum subsp. pinnipediorum]|uniref:DNA adenine methylase n=1 Tax=Campylobacter pinnipediorum TaxID=1965231 RepID=UPI00084DC16B|nr:DNA adenine methylase [Campylobacter pinnipediorum]AQW81245.1 adenine-specific DNA methyltransferase [Campylobacter pinnipediorum subsp. pinnipediorum]AQW84549.1 adenine-specific DNA methyltransferase [Campylobacter pinnipediorum subsp. pinnipediorum]OPA78192.1 DNA methyltransferase [Campylobacter pinnipediorum subsp. pinnipediorum]